LTDYFLDASAVVKRYVVEAGTAWIIAETSPAAGNATTLAEVTLVEVAAALAARQRASGGISVGQRDQLLGRFLQDCAGAFLLVPANRPVVDLAVQLTRRHRLRGYDAVQLAAALLIARAQSAGGRPPLVFVSADNDLLAAAQAEGLTADNPLNH
jgi:uncharacterized protein